VSYVSQNTHLSARRTFALYTETAPYRSLATQNTFDGSKAYRWSLEIAARYRVKLSHELSDWFDCGVCEQLGAGEFCEPATPKQLLSDAPECIWPGLMPPDVLPLVGNGLGDWLCGRVSAQNTIDEIIYWYHGGGDHLPYGTRLAEAIVFDTLAERLPGRRQFHAIPAERESIEYQSIVSGVLVEWAVRHLPPDVESVLSIDAPPSLIASELNRHKIASAAVRCDAVLAALDNQLRVRLTNRDAVKLGVSWDRDVSKWMFDTATIPLAKKQILMDQWEDQHGHCFYQDWTAVEEICEEVARERNDLGWVHDCLGWSAQRRGDVETAKRHYERSAMTSVFTDQAVRFRTHFDNERVAKFSVARLLEMGVEHRIDPQYIAAVSDTTNPHWRLEVEKYWLQQADAPESTDRQRYDLIYRAGWDVGCDSMRGYRDLLIKLSEAAMRVGQVARAEVAKTHAACIEERYGNRAKASASP